MWWVRNKERIVKMENAYCFPRDSISDIRRRVRRFEALLREIAANTRDLRRSHAVEAPASILSKDEDSESVFGQLVDNEKEDVSFEAVILRTKVYSNMFTGILETPENDHSDDARTIIDAPVSSTDPIPVSNTAPESLELALHAQQITSLVESQGIIGIFAVTMTDYAATSDKELSYMSGQRIHGLKPLTRSQYEGYLVPSLGAIAGGPGHFDRSQVMMTYLLRHPIRLRIVRASNTIPSIGSITLHKGEKFEIKVSFEHFSPWYIL
jgi:hypothetical protein